MPNGKKDAKTKGSSAWSASLARRKQRQDTLKKLIREALEESAQDESKTNESEPVSRTVNTSQGNGSRRNLGKTAATLLGVLLATMITELVRQWLLSQ